MIAISGICFWPGISSKRKCLIIIDNMILASNIAKFCPIQERGPVENGNKCVLRTRSSNLNGSNLKGSCQYSSELFYDLKKY